MADLDRLKQILMPVEAAEEMAAPGSHEHAQYVKAALMNAWPHIKAWVEAESRRR